MALTTLNLKHSRARLTEMFLKHIEEPVAKEAINIAANKLAITSNWFDRDQALQILDSISQSQDKVGSVARLLKVRVRLDWDNLA
ncbi:MAG: hypothetical protein HY819_14605 [Acidobacteria bacterium]|nr:hypothetical protein [Acidobacteriota bacterium]